MSNGLFLGAVAKILFACGGRTHKWVLEGSGFRVLGGLGPQVLGSGFLVPVLAFSSPVLRVLGSSSTPTAPDLNTDNSNGFPSGSGFRFRDP